MKMFKLIACLTVANVCARGINVDKQNLIPVDKIEAIIFGDEATALITESDLKKLTLEGRRQTLPDKIFEVGVVMEAKKMQIPQDESAVDRYIEMIMREHNLSLDDIKSMFSTAGYTFEEGREQLAMMFSVNTMIDFKIKSRLIVPEAQIIAYYNEHPIVEEESYRLQRIFVKASKDETAEDVAQIIDRAERMNKQSAQVQKSTAVWVKRSELAADKEFVTTMKVAEVSEPVRIKDGFEAFKLLEKRERRTVPLDERYRQITEELKKPLFEKLFQEYRQSLFDSASIVYF